MNKAFLVFAMAAGLSTSAMAAEYKGYIIDEKCSTKPAMKGNVECNTKCIKEGSAAVLVTDEGKVYKIADQAKVTSMAGKQVTINGTMKDDTISVSSVK
jgi:hypothetical protein